MMKSILLVSLAIILNFTFCQIFELHQLSKGDYYLDVASLYKKMNLYENPNKICNKPGFFDKKLKVYIIGAGIAGISAATYINDAGKEIDVEILEASNRIGGRIQTDNETFSTSIDIGASYYIFDEYNPLNQFIEYKNIALASTVEGGHSTKYFFSDGSHQLKNPEVFKKNIYEKISGVLEQLDEDNDEDELDIEEFDELITTKTELDEIERLYFDHIKRILYHTTSIGVKQVEGLKLLFKSFLSQISRRVAFIPGGYLKLFDHLFNSLKIKFNTEIKKIEDDFEQSVIITDKENNVYKGDYVITTIPLAVLKSEKIEFEPFISFDKDDVIMFLPVQSYGKFYIEFKEKFWGSETNLVFVDNNELDLTNCYSLYEFTQKNILVCLFGEYSPQIVGEMAIGDVLNRVVDILRTHLSGVRITPLGYKRVVWTSEPYSRGTGVCFYDVCPEEVFDYLAMPESRILFAGDYTQPIYHSTVRGAWMSGYRVSREILNSFNDQC